jgi:hypothetical protein
MAAGVTVSVCPVTVLADPTATQECGERQDTAFSELSLAVCPKSVHLARAAAHSGNAALSRTATT